jgi:hypothetical protein
VETLPKRGSSYDAAVLRHTMMREGWWPQVLDRWLFFR